MPVPRDPTPPGTRSGLGAHVVGQRVVVRRVLRGQRGPSGGPAMTDLLGTCLAWEDDVCVVVPDGGEDRTPVRIPLADIVSGKPVPPRPSVRSRVTPDAAQRRAMTLFPGLVTAPLGAWTLRRAPHHAARRANSALAMEDPGLDDEAAYRGVVDFYDGHGARPIAAVLRGEAPEALFLERGWVPESGDADTVFQLASVARLARALRAAGAGAGTPVALEVREERGTATVVLTDDGAEVASGVAAVDGDWVGFRSIAVATEHRRRGLGTAVMAALVERAAERGATTAYLQVLADNDPALALYAGLGFADHHRYRYLAIAQPGEPANPASRDRVERAPR